MSGRAPASTTQALWRSPTSPSPAMSPAFPAPPNTTASLVAPSTTPAAARRTVTNSTFSENSAFLGRRHLQRGQPRRVQQHLLKQRSHRRRRHLQRQRRHGDGDQQHLLAQRSPSPNGGGIMNLGTAEFTNTIMFLSSCDGGVAIGSTNNLIDANTVTACGSFTSSDAVLLGVRQLRRQHADLPASARQCGDRCRG